MFQVVAFLITLVGINWVIGRLFTPTAPTLAGILAFLIPSVWMPTLVALLLMGVFWAAWHIPAFFTPGMPHQQFPLFSTLFFIAPFGAFKGLLFNRGGQSVLITIAAHLPLNITTAMGGVDLSSPAFWRIMAASFWLITLLLTIADTLAVRTRTVFEPTA